MTKEPIIIKKYPNRRLYNTDTSQYVTLEDLFILMRQGSDFKVIDAKEGTDITRSILTQIIFEQETKGYNMLPLNFLKMIILMYRNNSENVFNDYLENSMKFFTENMNNFENIKSGTSSNPFDQYMKMFEQNISMYKNMFNSNTESKKDDDSKR